MGTSTMIPASDTQPSDPLLHIVLFEPEIPQNTGNVIRLSANAGLCLHLIQPLGFQMDSKALRRAGLDYHETAQVQIHETINHCFNELSHTVGLNRKRHFYAISTKGGRNYSVPSFKLGDVVMFGPESRGLPAALLNHPTIDSVLRIPMQRNSRSINLSNAVAIVTYEALRQCGFQGLQ